MALKLNDFDPARYLDDDEAIRDYLEAILEEGDAGLLAAALGDIAKAHGMSDIAHDSGIAREALYKALRADAQPRFDTIARVLGAIGLKLTIQAIK